MKKFWLWVCFILPLLLGGSVVSAAPRSRHTGPSVRVRTLSRSDQARRSRNRVLVSNVSTGMPAGRRDARNVSTSEEVNVEVAHHVGAVTDAQYNNFQRMRRRGEAPKYKRLSGRWANRWVGVLDPVKGRYSWNEYIENGPNGLIDADHEEFWALVYEEEGKPETRLALKPECRNILIPKTPYVPPAQPRTPTKRKIRVAIQKVRLCDHGCPEGSHLEPFNFSLKLKTEVCARTQAKGMDKCSFAYAVEVSSDDKSDLIFEICEELTDAQRAAGWEFLSAKVTNGVTSVHINFASPDEVVVQVTNLFRHKVTPPGPTKRTIVVGVQKIRACDQATCADSHMESFHHCVRVGGKECAAVDTPGADVCFFAYSVTVSSDDKSDIVLDICEELTDAQRAAGWEFLSARATKGVTQVRVNFASPDKVIVQVTNLFRHRPVRTPVKITEELPPPPAPPILTYGKSGYNPPQPQPEIRTIRPTGQVGVYTYNANCPCNACRHHRPGEKPPTIPPGHIPKGGGKTPRDPITGKPPVDRVPGGF